MAYDASKESRTVLTMVDKNNHGEKIQVCRVAVTGKDTDFGDVRLMYTTEDGELRPTNKGVRFPVRMAAPLVNGLVGLLTDEEKAALKESL